MTSHKFTSRPAVESDIAFLWELRQLTMTTHVEKSYGWNAAEQFAYACEHLQSTKIILIDERPVGMIKVVDYPYELFLSQVQIHPAWSGHRIGHKLVSDVVERAKVEQKTIRLHVLKVNPALKIYRSLGFVESSSTEHQLVMLWKAE